MRHYSILFTLMAVLGINASRSEAAPTWPYFSHEWSSNAASCIADNASIQNNTFETVNGYVHTTGSSPVILYCPIETLFADETEPFYTQDVYAFHLTVTYKGKRKTGLLGPALTKAELVAMSKFSGAETVLGSLITTGSTTVFVQGQNIFVDWDEANNTYYVRLTLQPSSCCTGYDQTVYGVYFYLAQLG